MGRPKKITEEKVEVETPELSSKLSSDRQEALDRAAGIYKKG